MSEAAKMESLESLGISLVPGISSSRKSQPSYVELQQLESLCISISDRLSSVNWNLEVLTLGAPVLAPGLE